MLKFGIPPPAVKLKMQQDGVNPDVLDCDASKPLPKKYVSVEDQLEAYIDGPPVKEEPLYQKYFQVNNEVPVCDVLLSCAPCSYVPF